jgi:hypothetical protein
MYFSTLWRELPRQANFKYGPHALHGIRPMSPLAITFMAPMGYLAPWVDGPGTQADRRADGRTVGRKGRRADGRTGGRADGRADGRAGGQAGGRRADGCGPSLLFQSKTCYHIYNIIYTYLFVYLFFHTYIYK